MVKKHGMPAFRALPLCALLVYLICLIVFGYAPNLIHANVLKGMLVAWTPILIIGGAILLFSTMEVTGCIDVIKKWLNKITGNTVAQLMIVGWAFPFLIEGASGFGTPAAIAAPILVGLGFPPVKIAILTLIMNTVPVSFGAVGTPTWFGFSEIALSAEETLGIAFRSATLHALIAPVIVIVALLQVVEFKEIRKNILFILMSVFVTVCPYWIISLYDYEFPSLVGGAIGLGLTVLLARNNVGVSTPEQASKSVKLLPMSTGTLIKATFPLWGTILMLVITRIPQLGIKQLLTSEATAFRLPLGTLGDFVVSQSLVLNIENIFQTSASWSHKTLYVPSILPFMFISMVTFWWFKTPSLKIKATFQQMLGQMRQPALALMGALVFVNLMMMGAETSAVHTIGKLLAWMSGDSWTFFASFLGALGSFFSGSATVSNLTFAGIQDSIAMETALDRTTILALQSVGGAFGNMVCINNIIAVASVLALKDKEGYILKKTVWPMLLYGILAGMLAIIIF